MRAQLARILASKGFAVSERGRRFLTYVVDETLAGRGERIKAYTVGIEVFGRDESFDAQGDPVVRLEAGRLRRALEHYYLTEGRDDPIEIVIPKGNYQPVFRQRAAEPPHETAILPEAARDGRPVRKLLWPVAAAVIGGLLLAGVGTLAYLRLAPGPVATAVVRPSVLVAPFAERAGSGGLAQGVTDQVVAELTRFREIVVYGHVGAATDDGRDLSRGRAQQLGATHLLEGSVATSGDKLRVTVRLEAVADGAVVWSASFDRDQKAADLFALQDEIAREVATRIAQPYGELARTAPQAVGRPDDLDAYRCRLAFYAYRRTLDRAEYPRVVECLRRTVAHHPDYATGWATLAMALVDSDRFGFPAPAGPPPLEEATAAARRAIALDANDVRAWQALMLASYLRSDVTEGQAAGERALELNPNDLELVGEYGMRLAMAGDWDRGTAMIRSVIDRDPAGVRFHYSILALDAIRRGEHAEALGLLDRSSPVNVPTSDLLRAAALGHLGRTDEAREAGARALQALPGFLDRLDAEFRKRNLQADSRQALIEGWARADALGPGLAEALKPADASGSPAP